MVGVMFWIFACGPDSQGRPGYQTYPGIATSLPHFAGHCVEVEWTIDG